MTATSPDTDHLLGSMLVESESIQPAEAGRQAKLSASSPLSVKRKKWGYCASGLLYAMTVPSRSHHIALRRSRRLLMNRNKCPSSTLTAEHGSNHTGQSVKALAKIYRLRAEVNRSVRRTSQHTTPSDSSPRSVRQRAADSQSTPVVRPFTVLIIL